jgi:hypothetical protein
LQSVSCAKVGAASRPSGVVAHRRERGSFPGAALVEAARRDGGERKTFACAAALVMQPTLIALFPSFQSRSMSAAQLSAALFDVTTRRRDASKTLARQSN